MRTRNSDEPAYEVVQTVVCTNCGNTCVFVVDEWYCMECDNLPE